MNYNEILKLINLKQEGGYWDFKREWYRKENSFDMLHDIICMANNLENRDAYIIIGVDEEKDYAIVGIEKDLNRYNTQNLIDFLSSKRFAGGIRPIVYVENIEIQEKIIDIIVIQNSFNTPYYLEEKYKSVNQNNIYTRVMDTNTPKNKNADIKDIEYLWKKRFRLLTTPIERIQYYLQNINDWEDSPTKDRISSKYYKLAPEFTIQYESNEDLKGYEYYLLNQYDSTPHWYDIYLYYHQTLLTSFQGVWLDGGRYFTPTPEIDFISLDKYNEEILVLRFFINNSLKYEIHKFYYKFVKDDSEANYSYEKFIECIIIFSDENEKEKFEEFVVLNWFEEKNKYLSDIKLPYIEDIPGYNMKVIKQKYMNMQILKNMYEKFQQ